MLDVLLLAMIVVTVILLLLGAIVVMAILLLLGVIVVMVILLGNDGERSVADAEKNECGDGFLEQVIDLRLSDGEGSPAVVLRA